MTKLHLIKAAEKSKTKNTGELGDKNRRGSNCIPHVWDKTRRKLEIYVSSHFFFNMLSFILSAVFLWVFYLGC